MGAALLDLIQDRHNEKHAAATKRYRELLDVDEPSPKLAAELESVMQTIGKTPEDFRADVWALTELKKQVIAIEAARGIQARSYDLEKQFEASQAYRQELLDGWQMEHNKLLVVMGELGALRGNAVHAARKAVELKERHPMLRDIAVPDPTHMFEASSK